jgi:hypothetical protein
MLNKAYTNDIPETHPGVLLEASANEANRSVTTLGEHQSKNGKEYDVVRVNVETQGVLPGKYLVDPATKEIAFLVDPGIGGRVHEFNGVTYPKLDSPKATIMALVTDGILTRKLPWTLVLLGVFITAALELAGLPSLPVAVGIYLPISTSSSMFAGGAVRWLVERRKRGQVESLVSVESGPGVLFASGLIAGGSIGGIAIAAIAAAVIKLADAAKVPPADYLAHKVGLSSMLGGFATSDLAAIVIFCGLGWVLYRVASDSK